MILGWQEHFSLAWFSIFDADIVLFEKHWRIDQHHGSNSIDQGERG